MKMLNRTASRRSNDSGRPEFTLRKKYMSRPASVIIIEYDTSLYHVSCPEDSEERAWLQTDNTLMVKTWQSIPLPHVQDMFTDIPIHKIQLHFNIGPLIEDLEGIEQISSLDCKTFCLEFREHWAGPYPKVKPQNHEEEKLENSIDNFVNQTNLTMVQNLESLENSSEGKIFQTTRKSSYCTPLRIEDPCNKSVADSDIESSLSVSDRAPYDYSLSLPEEEFVQTFVNEPDPSDMFVEPFLKNGCNITILTGRLSTFYISKVVNFGNLRFLGLRCSLDEYLQLQKTLFMMQSLQRLHLLPQWKFDASVKIPTLKFCGLVTVYYWDAATTQAIQRAHRKWKKKGFNRKNKCCIS